MIKRKKGMKQSYSAEEVCTIHNRYRLLIGILLAVFLFVLHRLGVAPEFISAITGGAVKIKKGWTFYKVILEIGRWLGIAIPVGMAIVMIVVKVKKKV